MSENLQTNIFVVNTTYHILVACSMGKKGDILINSGSKNYGTMIHDMIFKTFGNNIFSIPGLQDYKSDLMELIKFRKNMKLLKINISKKSVLNIIIFNDVNPEVQWIINEVKRKGKVILIEEGIGLYRDIKKRHNLAFELFGKILFGYKFENIKRIGESKKVEQIVCKNFSLLSPKQAKKNIVYFDTINFNTLKNKLIHLEDIKETTWFIGQPLVEDGILSERKYLEIINKLKNISSDFDLVVKPHPRENINKYKSIYGIRLIEENDIPIELMINIQNSYKFFTIYSSAITSVSNYGEAFALFKIAKIKLPKEIEYIFKEASVFVLNNWDEVKLNEKN